MSAIVNENGKRPRTDEDNDVDEPVIHDSGPPFNFSTGDCILPRGKSRLPHSQDFTFAGVARLRIHYHSAFT